VTRTLWFRILAGAVIGVVLVQAAAGLTVYVVVRSHLRSAFDASLAARLRTLSGLVEQEGGEVEVEFEEQALPEWAAPESGEYVQVWIAGGALLYRSPSLGEHDLARIDGRLDAPTFGWTTLPGRRSVRAAGASFTPPEKHAVRGRARTVTLVVARAIRDTDRSLAILGLVLAAAWVGAAGLTAVVLDWIVSRGVRPVRDLTAQIADIRDAGLSARVALDNAPAELAPVVARLNDLLAQLDAAFEREKAFTANVAHELRTPLTGLLTTLELALSRERTPDAYRDAIRRCHVVCSQMSGMVDNLLCLARAESGRVRVKPEPVDLDGLLNECWGPLSDRAEERGLHVTWSLDGPADLITDRGLLRMVLLNVLSNAVNHADEGGTVRIRSGRADGGAEIVAANSGSALTGEEARRACDRFWQGDAARSATGVHCGLGLALCRTLVGLLGGRLRIAAEAGGEFVVTLELPADGARNPQGS